MLFFLILLLPSASPLYVFENMIEPYLKEPIPTIFLSQSESKYINLNSYYGGSQLKFTFNAFTDPYIIFAHNESVSNSNKPVTDSPVEFIIFPDQNGLNVSGAMLTDDNKVYSIIITNIYQGESDVSFQNSLLVPDDLICKRMTRIDSMSVILDCDSVNIQNPPQFLLVNFYLNNNTIKNVDQKFYRINNSYNCQGYEDIYRNCTRSLRYENNFLFRYCPKSKGSSCGSLEIFSLDLQNYTAVLYNLISVLHTIDGNFTLMMQDLEIYDTQDIFILDYHLGLYELSFTQNGYQIIQNDCPSILGGNYYAVTFDCFDKSGIHDDFQQCKLIITSLHYITELTYSKNLASPCCFSNRKNLGEDVGTIHDTYASTNFLIVYYANKNASNNSLNVYDRNDMNTNILYQLSNLSSDTMITLVTAKTDFFFSPSILNKLIVFTKNDKQLKLINIGQNIISFSCCNNGFPLDPLHTAYLDYSVSDLMGEVKRKDRIFIKTVDFQDTSIFSENNTYSYQMKLSFLNYKASLSNFLKGSNQQYTVENMNSLKLSVKEINSFYPPIFSEDEDLIFLKIIKINLNYFFFIQNQNFSLRVEQCTFMSEDNFPEILDSTLSCWKINHDIEINTIIKDILSKEDVLIVQMANYSLFSCYFTNQTFKYIKYDQVLLIDDKPLNCSTLLFSLISSHCLCIAYTTNNDFQVSIFVPFNSSDHNNSKIQSYTYANEYPDEKFTYFDQTLLSSDIILAKGPHCIHILKMTYSENEGKNSLKTVMVIDNEYTNVTNQFDGFHFNIIKSTIHQKINLILTNYEQNVIVEYNFDDLISPMYMRKYPLFNFTLNNTTYITTINDAYFLVGCSLSIDQNSDDIFYLIYDVFESTESTLIKIINTDELSELYVVLERNRPILNPHSYETYELDFLIFNKSQANQSVFQEYRPASLKGLLNLSAIEKSIIFNDSTNNYTTQTNYDENANFTYNVTVTNAPLSNCSQNITYTVKFDYSSTIISYSSNFLQNPHKNFSSFDLSEINNASLPQFFGGPVVTYQLENDKPESSRFSLRTFIELQSQWNLNDKINDFNMKKQSAYILGNDSRTTLLVIPTDDYVFILKNFLVFMLNLSSIENDDQFNVIDVFDLGEIDETLTRCNAFETDYDNLTNTNLFIGCENESGEPLLYVLLYNDNGFDRRIREMMIIGMVSKVNSLKIMDNFIFVINGGVENMNDCSIFILQIDLPIDPEPTIIVLNTSIVIALTNLYILNAQSFNVDYLYIIDFELNCFGVINNSYIYGIILNDQYALYYCEISINPQNKIDNFYNKSVSDFVLESNTELDKLDLRNLLNLSFRNAEGAPSITCYWLVSNVFGEMFILISTPYELIEIKTSRFYFSGYFEVYQDFQEYSDCLNNHEINTRAAKNPQFLAFPCILTNVYSPIYNTYLKLYLKNVDAANSSKIPISQMLIFPASKFNDFFFAENQNKSNLFVINDTVILQYNLQENLWLERKMLNRTVSGHENNLILLKAINNISIAEVKMNINNGFFIKNDWVMFYALIVAPLIFCFFGMVLLFAIIKYSRTKRKGMLLKLRDE